MLKNFIIVLGILVITACSLVYLKYNRFLPSTHLPQQAALTQLEIQHIRQQTPIDQIKVLKSKRSLQILHKEQIIRTYPIRLGFNPIGHKVQEGDGKTPEGTYAIDWRNPNSQFYKSFHISYPNQH